MALNSERFRFRHWNRISREVTVVLSMETFKATLNWALLEDAPVQGRDSGNLIVFNVSFVVRYIPTKPVWLGDLNYCHTMATTQI